MFNSLMHKLSTSKYMRYIFVFATLLLLSACDSDSAIGGDKNYEVQSRCWQTKIVDAVLKIINSLYKQSSQYVTQSALSTGGAAVIAIAFSVWMAFRLLKILPSFKEENLGEIWTEIGQKLFVCAFCMYIVYNPANISWAIKTFVLPIYNAILELGVRMLKASSTGNSQELGEYGTISYIYNFSACEVRDAGSSLDMKSAITPMANCLICSISDRLNTGIKIGVELLCKSFFPPSLGGIIVGLIVLFLYTAAKFSFVLFIVDSLFRLNFAVFLLPIFIIGIPFNYTRKWSKHCFLMFLNSSGVMFFLGLLVIIGVASLESIYNAVGGDLGQLEGFGPVMLSILFISFLIVNIPGMGVALADKFIGGGGTDEFQKKITKFVISTVKKMGAAALSTVTSSASKMFTDTMEKYEATREVLDTAKQIQNKVTTALNDLAGYNDD